MLALRLRKIKATDILDLLIQRVRKPSGKDVWRHECPEVTGTMEWEEMFTLGWKEGMSRQETHCLFRTVHVPRPFVGSLQMIRRSGVRRHPNGSRQSQHRTYIDL